MILTARFQKALVYAAQLHANQMRKGSDVPYIAHLLGVASLVLEYGGSEDEAIAALLHDAVEDQGGAQTLEIIRSRFGITVAMIVLGCSDSQTFPKPPWRQRKEAYLAHLRNSLPGVLLVTSADKLYNARSILSDYRHIGPKLWERFKGDKEGTLWYYHSLVVSLSEFGMTPIVAELARTVEEIERVVKEREG